MTYQSSEISVAGGAPIELHNFKLGTTNWNVTSYGEDYEYLGKTYESVPCGRTEIEQSEDPFRDKLEVTLPRGHAFSNLYISGTPEGEVTYTLYRGHGAFFVIFYTGIVDGCIFDTNGTPKIIITPKTSGNIGTGRRRRCQKLCDRVLYEYGCGVQKTSYDKAITVGSVDGLVVTSNDFNTNGAGYYTGGMLIIDNHVRFIKAHGTTTVTLNRIISGLAAGDEGMAYAGCDHTGLTCRTKFDNKLNFGGEEYLPWSNPYENSMSNSNNQGLQVVH